MTDYGLLRRLKGDKMPEETPKAQPMPSIKLSQRAGMIAQQMESLEDELGGMTVRAQEQENRAEVAEAQLHDTKDALRVMQSERDYFQRRFLETNAKLRSAASIVLDCIRESEKDIQQEQEVSAYKPKDVAQQAVARALARSENDPDQPPLPGFLHKKDQE